VVALIAFIINDFRLLFRNDKPLTQRVRRIIWVSSGPRAILVFIAIAEVAMFILPDRAQIVIKITENPLVLYWSWIIEGFFILIICVCGYLENKE